MNPALQAFPLPGKATFSGAVRAGDFLLVSGLTATDAQRRVVGATLAEQARFIYGKLGHILGQAGAGFADVVETVDYVTTFEGYEDTAEVRREVFGAAGPFPAATGVRVVELVRPGALIEIRAIAWLGGRP
jgi:aminoacrylate peracid reductase